MKSATKRKRKSRKKPVPRSTAHRLRSVKRVLDGFSAVEVGRRYGDSPRAVAYWVTRFKTHGAAGLDALPRSGRPAKLTPAQLKKLGVFVNDARARSAGITGNSLARFIKEKFGVTLTRQHCRRLVIKLGTPISPP